MNDSGAGNAFCGFAPYHIRINAGIFYAIRQWWLICESVGMIALRSYHCSRANARIDDASSSFSGATK